MWYIWLLLLPLALCSCCCPLGVIYVRTQGPLPLLELRYVDAAAAPKTPKVLMTTKTITETVRIPKSKLPKPKPKAVVVEKKKWDMVATGQYLRNGAFMETNWGKHGEMGGETYIHEEEESDSDDGKSKGGAEEEAEEQVALHETFSIQVDIPVGNGAQIVQLVGAEEKTAKRGGEGDEGDKGGRGQGGEE